MLLTRFYDTKLAQASYLVGCQATGEALIIDPNRDIDQYLSAVKAEKMKLAHVTETHIHADFVSGSRELAERSGAELLLSDEGGKDWRYGYANGDGATLMKDGHRFKVGNIIVQVMHTPGHTPEHMSFMITDGAATDKPMGVFTGDFIFVGDVGRPDLLEKAAGIAGSMDAAAKQLFRSLQSFKKLPDYLQLWPGHGAGSACGKALGAVPSSTLGYERIANWALGTENESDFVAMVLAGQPEPPVYFAQMKRINRDGPRPLGSAKAPLHLSGHQFADLIATGATLVDTRPATAFARGHMAGALNIPLNSSFTTWSGWLVAYDKPFCLIVDGEAAAAEAARDLSMIGLDQLAGWVEAGASDLSEKVRQQSVEEVAANLDGDVVKIIDVRWKDEWDAGHLPGALHMPLGHLREQLAPLHKETPLVLHCQSGGRSAIAASLAQAMGFTNVSNMAGGWTGWKKAGLPVEGSEALKK